MYENTQQRIAPGTIDKTVLKRKIWYSQILHLYENVHLRYLEQETKKSTCL